ncbi:MAG: hypothetical protein Q7S56_00645 [Nanoarchaeota archaeon]|nr:hypothetical protein [Nanoarchaeota archaeon]
MVKRHIGFHVGETEELNLKSYTGHWVSIKNQLGDWEGQVVKIEDGAIYLLPYQKSRWDSNGMMERIIIEKGLPLSLPLHNSSIMPNTRENTRGYSIYVQKKFQRDEIKERIEFERIRKDSLSNENYSDGAGI